jgi:hypothetical protein
MTKPRTAKPTVQFIDDYSELYKDLFPEVEGGRKAIALSLFVPTNFLE